MIVVRFLFALLLGVVIGAGATVYLLQSEAGDLLVRRTAPVQDLERRLRDVEQQRDLLGRQLDDIVGRAGRMDTAFGELERRFKELQQRLEQGRAGAPGG